MPSKRWTIHQKPRRKTKGSQTTPGRPDWLSNDTGQANNHEPAPFSPHLTATPAIYHCVNRVVDRRFIFGDREKDKFVKLMRMYESFAGIRILAHCIMSNHFHIMVEIRPSPEDGLHDDELLDRLAYIYDEATVESVANELREARAAIEQGRASVERAETIHERYTYRMHDLSEFMKSLVQRFTQWYNRRNQRKGNLWEDAFRSVVVAPGAAARLVAAYIDLNPVRAGIVNDPADYRWSSYGEASPRLSSGHIAQNPVALNARAGLVRAFFANDGMEADAKRWTEMHKTYRNWIEDAMSAIQSQKTNDHSQSIQLRLNSTGGALTVRIRHFSEGVAIGNREFINQFFNHHREKFGPKRVTGARPIRGHTAAFAKEQEICTIRDLQKKS